MTDLAPNMVVIAQLAELRIVVPKVLGSSPSSHPLKLGYSVMVEHAGL